MFDNRLTYKYYNIPDKNMLVMYNYDTMRTLLYEDLSALLIYNILSGNEKDNEMLLTQNDITHSEYNEFIDECLLLSSNDDSKSEFTVREEDENIGIETEFYNHGLLYSAHIDITPHCNFRCIHCYHPFEKYESVELSYSEIEKLFEDLNSLGVFHIVISGGEPFLRKDIYKIIELGAKYNFIFEIFTNGSLLTEKDIEYLSKQNVSKLSFSYYGDKSQYEYITKSNCYDTLMNNVEYCKKYGVDYELKLILMKCNQNHLPEFHSLTQRLEIPTSIELNITPKLDKSTDNLSEKLDIDDYVNIITHNNSLFENFIKPVDTREHDTIQCNAGKYSLYCDYKGDIYPCVSYRKLLGTYKELKKIWGGDLLRSVTSKCNVDFSSFKKHSYCDYCYEICPGLSVIEGKDEYDCNNSGCEISKAIEKIQLKKGGGQ